jgi:hypothetical protein
MRNQSGVSTVAVVAGIAVLAVAAASFFAWQKTTEADRAKAEAAVARAELDKARADARKAEQGAAAAAKEASQAKVASERLLSERDAVRTQLETALATGEQWRAELAVAKDQVSYLSARSSKDVVRGMPKSASAKAPAQPPRQ